MHIFLLDLMRKFELCCEFYDNGGHYLVPELLGKVEPDLSAFETNESLRFDYRYNIVPEGLLPRFIVRSRALNRAQARWRTGVILEWERNSAVVKADPQDRHVSISVIGPVDGRRRLLSVLRADLEHIHRSIPKLQARGQLPVPGHGDWPWNTRSYLSLRAREKSNTRLSMTERLSKSFFEIFCEV
jgi:internalin A